MNQYITFIEPSIESTYSFLSALLRSRETFIATNDDLVKALKSNNIVDAVSNISHTSIGDFLSKKIRELISSKAVDAAVYDHLSNELKYIALNSPRKISNFIQLYVTKYDVYNILLYIRSITLKTGAMELIPCGLIAWKGMLNKLINITDLDTLIDFIHEAGLHIYADLVRINRSLIEAKAEDKFYELESILMNKYYELLNAYLAMLGDYLTSTCIRMMIDIHNIILVLKKIILGILPDIIKKIMIKGGMYITHTEYDELLRYERIDQLTNWLKATPYKLLSDKILIALKIFKNNPSILDIVFKSFNLYNLRITLHSSPLSLQPVITYVVAKELEASKVSLILRAIVNGSEREPFEKLLLEIMV